MNRIKIELMERIINGQVDDPKTTPEERALMSAISLEELDEYVCRCHAKEHEHLEKGERLRRLLRLLPGFKISQFQKRRQVH